MKSALASHAIPASEPLAEHINQSGVTFGPDKLEIFREACRLRGATLRSSSKVARVKIFDPCGSWTWFVSSWNPKTNECLGLVKGDTTEFGSFSLEELSTVRGPLGIGLEVDVWFEPHPLDSLGL